MQNSRLLMRLMSSILCLISMQTAHAMNWLRPYDPILRPELHWEKPWLFVCWAEAGVKPASGYNSDDHRVNVLQIENPNQDAIAMLNGFSADSIIGQLRIQLNANDDGVRGHFIPTGELRETFRTNLGAYYKFNDFFWVAAYLPIMGEQLTKVTWVDQTQLVTPADYRVKQYLTNDFFTNVASLSNGLQLCGWKRAGLGDAMIMVEWFKQYPQRREILRNVILNWSVGLSFPTGLKTDYNKIMALPFGYDGAYGLVFGGELQAILGNVMRFGMDIRLTHLFGNTRERRIKTAIDQTELLLLAKTPAYKDFGLIQFFNLWGTAYHVVRGFSCTVGYQFYKKGVDNLQLLSCNYSSAIANTSISLQEWTVHQAVINLMYDIGHDMRDTCVWPQISLFARIPFNGRRSAAFTTVGVMFGCEF